MKMIHFLSLLLFSVLLSACAAVRGGGDVERGRQALLAGNYQAALGNFHEAAEEDPNYIYGAELRGSLELRAEPNTSPGTMPCASDFEKPFPSTGTTISHGYRLRCIVWETKRRQ
jgi:predicted small secreted protein